MIPEGKEVKVAIWSELPDRKPQYALVGNVDLVVIRYDDNVSVFYGRCHHRGALLSDGFISGNNLICGLHFWDYRYDTGISEYNNQEALHRFNARIDVKKDAVFVDLDEIRAFQETHPQPYNREEYLGLYADIHGAEEEPYNQYIRELARNGLGGMGRHGKMVAMGIPRNELPRWEDIQIVTAQLSSRPLQEDVEVDTTLVIGPSAKKPLYLKIPVFISDMSFGALSEEAKLALALGAEMAGTGICSGEGGMLPEEQASNSRYLYELASGKFGWSVEKAARCQAFHFKAGQGAKTGTGGHLPGYKVTPRIAEIRNIKPGQDAVSPPAFYDLVDPGDYRDIADEVREKSGGIPIGFKMSAQQIEKDIDFALEAGADYIILDGRGGATGAAPQIFRDNISIPTIPALARARRHLDNCEASHVTLIITGGLRTESDFVKALALGADGIAIANSALQAIGCLAMRACNTNNCPVGIATQKPELRARLKVEKSAAQLANFLRATIELMKVLARACGHKSLAEFQIDDLVTFKKEMSDLAGIPYAGVGN